MPRGSIKNTKTPRFYIENTSIKLKEDISNIAAHKGVSCSAFLRSEIIKIRDAYPEEMRKPISDD